MLAPQANRQREHRTAQGGKNHQIQPGPSEQSSEIRHNDETSASRGRRGRSDKLTQLGIIDMPKQTTKFTSNGPTQRDIATTPPNGPDDQAPAIVASMEEIVIDNDNPSPSTADTATQ